MPERPKKKLTINLPDGVTVKSAFGGVTIEVEIPVNEMVNLYGMVEATEFETGGSFNSASITFGFPTPPTGG